MTAGSMPRTAQQWLTDIFRREELDQIRWRLVIVTSEGIYREPFGRSSAYGMRSLIVGPSGSAGLSNQSGGCTSQSDNASRLETANVGGCDRIRVREPS